MTPTAPVDLDASCRLPARVDARAGVVVRLGASVVVTLLIGLIAGASPASAGAGVSGGGASFPQLLLEQLRADVSRPPYSLQIDYQAAGSTFGREKYLAGQLDYGVSDIPFQPDEAEKVSKSPRKNFVYVPVAAGALGFMYNIVGLDGQRITNLKLSQRGVCRAFTEDEIYWDDPEIAADNPGVPLPHDRVRPVVRQDGSGTSYVLAEYCISTAPQVWAAFIGLVRQVAPNSASSEFLAGRPMSQWPVGYGQAGGAFASEGVANQVANEVAGKSTITYVEAGFARERGFPNAIVRNGAGVFVPPGANNVSVALAYATGRSDGTFNLNYLANDPVAYFPSSYSYVIAQTTGFDPAKGQTLATFLNYAVTAGQKRAEALQYARLSTVLVNLALDKIVQIPGAPPRPVDLQGAPPPPKPIDISKVQPSGPGGAAPGPGGSAVTPGSKGAGALPGTPGAATPGARPGAAPGATPGGSAAPGTPGAVGPDGTPAAGSAVVEGATVSRDENGTVGLDAGLLAAGAEASVAKVNSGPTDPISDKDVLWFLLIGGALVAVGSSSSGRSRLGALAKLGKDPS